MGFTLSPAGWDCPCLLTWTPAADALQQLEGELLLAAGQEGVSDKTQGEGSRSPMALHGQALNQGQAGAALQKVQAVICKRETAQRHSSLHTGT